MIVSKVKGYYKKNPAATIIVGILAAAVVVLLAIWAWKVLLGALGLGGVASVNKVLAGRVKEDREEIEEVAEEVEEEIEELEEEIEELEEDLEQRKVDWRQRDKARIAAGVEAFKKSQTDWDNTAREDLP